MNSADIYSPQLEKLVDYLQKLYRRVEVLERNLRDVSQPIEALRQRLETLERQPVSPLLAAASAPADTLASPSASLVTDNTHLRERLATLERLLSAHTLPERDALSDSPTTLNTLTHDLACLRDDLTLLRNQVEARKQDPPCDTPLFAPPATFTPSEPFGSEPLLTQLLHTIFANDSTVTQAAQTLVNSFLTEHAPQDEHLAPLHDIAHRLLPLADALASQLQTLPSDIINPLQNAHEKVTALVQEIRDYEQAVRDQQLTLHVPVTFTTGVSHGIFERVSWALRNLSRKLCDPLGYFTESCDRLVTNEGVMLMDLCDTTADAAPLREQLMEILTSLSLHDTSPAIGTPFNPHHHNVISFCSGAPRDQILEVSSRGWQYRGKEIRKANVVIGR